MKKIFFYLICITLILCGGFIFFARAASLQAQQGSDSSETTQLEARIEKLSSRLEVTRDELSKKLDKVLSNQDTILKELAIIKVRASLK